MKRSKFVDLPRFQKNKLWRIAPLSLAVAAALGGCSRTEDVMLVSDVDDCTSKTHMDKSSCELAYQKAMTEAEQTSPRFDTRERCEVDFREHGCYQATGGFFVPFISGFLVNAALNQFSRNQYYHPVYNYLSVHGTQRVLSDGTPLGREGALYTVPKGTTKDPKPKVSKTISLGGFGSKASAKASWGSSRSGRSGGWGG